MNKIKFIVLSIFIGVPAIMLVYYFYPYSGIPTNIIIDKIVVIKSDHKLLAFSQNVLIKTFHISLGNGGNGDKQFEGDGKTPEGIYLINSKNPNSNFHKNLGISYPNAQDINEAKKLGKDAGGEIKIHGLKKGQGFFGKFQRWRDWTKVASP